MRTKIFTALALLVVAANADAARTIPLPASVCPGARDALFPSGFDSSAPAIPSTPSNGSGGAAPGDQFRVLNVPGYGTHAVYLHIPPGYTPSRPVPLLIALHGTAGAGAADAAARQVRADWSGIADAAGFIVLAPVASGAQGSWNPPVDVPVLSAAIDDAEALYDIEETRIDLWGFSAGAHLSHALALNNPDLFAAYGVSAGALTQYACSDDGSFQPTCTALLGGAEPKIPVDIHLGNQDPLYLSYGAGGDPSRFEHNGWVLGRNLFYTLFAGGHTYTIAQLGEIWGNICPFAVVE